MYIDQALSRAVQISPGKLATVNEGRERTWVEFKNRISRLAAGFRNLGIKKNDRIAILALNSDYYLEAFFASSWGGFAIVPVNIRLAPPEIAFLLDDAEIDWMIVDDTFAPMVEEIREKMERSLNIIQMGQEIYDKQYARFEKLIQDNEPCLNAQAGGDDIAGLFYTGGTTGRSKGVMLTHDNIMFNAINVIPAMSYGVDTVYLHAAPMFHLADMASTFAVTLAAGKHVFVEKFDPEEVCKTIEREKVTHVLLVPTMINVLVNFPDLGKYDLTSLERLLYGASPMPEAVLIKAMGVLPGVGFVQGYGQTEAAPVISTLEPEFHVLEGSFAGKLRSAGRAAIGVEVKVKGGDLNEAERGEVGEICARGQNVMKGYWKLQEETEKALVDGWLHTGDLGYMDEDGFIFLVDRAKDMIISGGENIYSVEVENVLYKHGAVQECAVIGIPDEKWGEKVHAIVVLKAGESCSEQQLIDFCCEYIAGYKCPRSVEFREDALPVSGAGKILKNELRVPWWDGKTRAVN